MSRATRMAAVLGALAALPAAAQDFKVTPSMQVFALMPGDPHPVSLAPGVGVQAGVGFFPRILAGQLVDLLQLDIAAFGGVFSQGQDVNGQIGIAALVGFGHFVSAGPFFRLAATQGGLLGGHFDAAHDVGLALHLGFDAFNFLQVGHGSPQQAVFAP